MRVLLPILIALTLTIGLASQQAMAVPTPIIFSDLQSCDPLVVPPLVDELGIAPAFTPFPDELITSSDTVTDLFACFGDLSVLNTIVTITNTVSPPRSFSGLWYVQNSDILHSNNDGIINGQPGFKIDAVGVNTPLISESIATDGIFEPGETWEFIIDDYIGPGPASAFLSIGAPSPPFGVGSTGSMTSLEIMIHELAKRLEAGK